MQIHSHIILREKLTEIKDYSGAACNMSDLDIQGVTVTVIYPLPTSLASVAQRGAEMFLAAEVVNNKPTY